MRNIKITIEYDGASFSGWQVQPGRRTVQGELIKAASKFSRGGVKVVGAGRTDAGVHAVGQVANFLTDCDYSLQTIRNALNGNLPPDILVRKTEDASLIFNARFDAYSKTYSYIFIRRKTALWSTRFLPVPKGLDADAMRMAAGQLTGERDFSSFSSTSKAKSGRCRIISASIHQQPPLIFFSVTADRFLYNMVRAMAGTLLEIGKGKSLDLKGIIESADRSAAGPTLPPHALYLLKVRYSPPSDPAG